MFGSVADITNQAFRWRFGLACRPVRRRGVWGAPKGLSWDAVLLPAADGPLMQIRGSLDREEIEQFLTDCNIPIRIACRTPGDRLWMLSLWFRYRDGGVYCATSKGAAVVSYLEYDDRIAFEVSTNQPPYRGVRGGGRATISDDPEKAVLRELLERYLGETDTPLGSRLLSDNREEVTISIDPSVVFGWDFTDRMKGSLDRGSGLR